MDSWLVWRVLALAFVGAVLSGRRSGGWRSFASSADGIAVSYPSGWRSTTHNDSYVPNPALCFDLVPRANLGVDLRVVEYLPPYFNQRDLRAYRPRPRQFRLGSFRTGDEDWSQGKIISFREHHRVFLVGLVLPAMAGQAIRRSVEQILDSLKVGAQGRCRPTSGVGSHGVSSTFPKKSQSK